jgi:primosomal protein N'
MTNSDKSILEMYEALGLSIDQIEQETGFDSIAIKMSLLQNSTKYSRENRQQLNQVGAQETSNEAFPIFNESDEEMAKRVLRSLAQNGELEMIQYGAAKTILKLNQEERASKRATLVGKTNFNIHIIQQQLEKAKNATRLVDVSQAPTTTRTLELKEA